MDVFSAAKRQFRLHLRPDEVRVEAQWPGSEALSLEQVQQASPAEATALMEYKRRLIDYLERFMRAALRALLMRPQLTGADPEFPLVRRHADLLRSWLLREIGWILHVKRDCARLIKRTADLRDGTSGAPGSDRRRSCSCV